MNKFIEKLIERLEEEKSNVPVNRILDNIAKDKPKELGQLIAYDKAIAIVNELAGEYTDKVQEHEWILVYDHRAQVMPQKSCEVWVTRSACGKRWVQKIDFYYHAGNPRFDWDGVIAWMPMQDKKPKPYDKQYWANEDISQVEFITD